MKRKTERKPRRTTHHPNSPPRNKIAVPRTAKQFFALSEEDQDRWIRVEHVVSKMRLDRISLTRASQEYGLDRRTVLRLAKSALRKRSNGRYAVKSHDTLLRVLVTPAPDGLREVAVRDSGAASNIAEHSEAIRLYFQKGDKSGLKKFKGMRIRDASGKFIKLLTDTQELDRLGNAGVLSFESLYARAS
jgi:hypothetical protein